MVFNTGDAHCKILIRRFRSLSRLFCFRAGQKVITGYIQSVSQKAKGFQAGLPESALIKPDGVEALSDDIC